LGTLIFLKAEQIPNGVNLNQRRKNSKQKEKDGGFLPPRR